MARRKKRNSGNQRALQSAAPPAGGAAFGRRSAGVPGIQNGMRAPVSFGVSVQSSAPRFIGNGKTLCIVHREYVTPVDRAVNFTLSHSLPINPGQGLTFPWLHEIARKFEGYRFRALRLLYIPACATSTPGSMSLAVDYDAADSPPDNVSDMASMTGTVRGPVWQPLTLVCDPDSLGLSVVRKFTRGGIVPPGKDIKTYDSGNMFIAVDGSDDVSGCGDIYVEYDVELFVPQPHTNDDYLEESLKIDSGAAVGVAKATPFGVGSSIGGLMNVKAENSRLTFGEAGQYLLDYYVYGTGLNVTAPSLIGVAGDVIAAVSGVLPNATATEGHGYARLNVKEPGSSIDFTFPTITSLTSVFARIAPYSYTV